MSASDRESTPNDPNEPAVPLARCEHLYLKTTPEKGRGVFTSRPLPASTILETSPVLPLTPSETTTHISRTTLHHYTYNWPLPNPQTNHPTNPPPKPQSSAQTQALILGLGSMFNHSTLYQNVGWTRDLEREVIVYRTLRDVEAGEELCISYGAPGRLTFVDAEAEEVRKREEEEERREVESVREGGLGGLGGIEL